VSPPSSRSPAVTSGVGAALGALTWTAWLGWDRTASYDPVTGTVQTPYVTLQVLGCALTVAVVTAVLAAVWHPAAAAAGVSLGFWVLWTWNAVLHDASGLFVVGSLSLAAGLAGGTAAAAALGAGVRRASEARRHRRAAGDASGQAGSGNR
jgi:hypothetical protein